MSKLTSRFGRAAVVLAAFAATAAAQAALAVTPAGTWAKAIEVPGTSALNADGLATVGAVSCASAGNCSAGGYYTDKAGITRPFAVTQHKDAWGKAVKISGPAALNNSKFAQITTISCGSAGNCLAGGAYALAGGKQAFIVTEKNGTWGKATAVPGLISLDSGHVAEVDRVACPSVGNCTVAGEYSTLELSLEVFGDYRDISQLTQAFVDTETNGVWGIASEEAGALNAGGDASATSVSCAKPGNCTASGQFQDNSNRHLPAIASRAALMAAA